MKQRHNNLGIASCCVENPLQGVTMWRICRFTLQRFKTRRFTSRRVKTQRFTSQRFKTRRFTSQRFKTRRFTSQRVKTQRVYHHALNLIPSVWP
jgi:hypothetical protein